MNILNLNLFSLFFYFLVAISLISVTPMFGQFMIYSHCNVVSFQRYDLSNISPLFSVAVQSQIFFMYGASGRVNFCVSLNIDQ